MIAIRLSRGNLELYILVITNAHDNNAVACLRNTVFFKLIEIGHELVTSLLKGLKNLVKGFTLISATKAADILSKEPQRLEHFQGLGTIGIKRTVSTVQALLLTHSREVIAGEAEG